MNMIPGVVRILSKAFLFSLLCLPAQIFAQQDFTIYNMEVIPQRMYQNPALKTWSRVNIGLPLISSQYLNLANSGFKYKHLIRRRADDSLYVDPDNMINKLGKRNYILGSFQPDLLSFGFAVKKHYFSFNITEKVNFLFKYQKQFVEFLWKGNGNMLDEDVPLNMRINFSHYREHGIGYARDWTDKLRLGAKLKYLYGMSNIYTKKGDINLHTESTAFGITTSANIQLMTSGYDTTTSGDEDFQISDYLRKKKNRGLGLDLGGVYQYDDKITLSASLIDIGFIRWKSHVNSFKSRDENGSFTYQGLPVDELIGNDTLTFEDLVTNLTDSASEALKIDTNYDAYSTWLPTKIYLGGQYQLLPKSTVGALIYNQFYDRRIHPGLSLSFTQRVQRWLSASLSYSAYNRSYTNIGFGLSMNGGPAQLYVVTDNLMTVFWPQSTKNVHVHFGINLTFGRPSGDKDKDGIPDKKDDCPTEPGLPEFAGCPDRDGDHVPDKKDACPDTPGLPAFDGCPDRDGDKIIDKKDSCPDVAGLAEFNGCPDRDGDKIIDKLDSCPDEAGLAKFNGCPDRDNDGVIDKIDACPDDSGAVATKGCPDKDGDLVLDKDDRCPEKPGPVDNDGCPLAKLHLLDKKGNVIASATVDKDGKFTFTDLIDESAMLKLESYDILTVNEVTVATGKVVRLARRGVDGYFHFEALPTDKGKLGQMDFDDVQVKLKKEEAEKVQKAMETLEFDFGKDVIRTSSMDGLDLVAELLEQNSNWRLKLSGHTDNVASLKFNMNLSKKRVTAVKKYLVKKGVSADRIVIKWYGPTKPVAPNDTEEGRQKNRRVEFLIIQ